MADLEKWLEIGINASGWVVAAFVAFYIFDKRIWPLFLERVKKQDQVNEKFVEALNDLSKTHERTSKDIVSAIQNVQTDARRARRTQKRTQRQ
jgi:hypothetical protein